MRSQTLYADPGYLVFLYDGALLAQPFDTEHLWLIMPRPVLDVDQVGLNPATPRGMFSHRRLTARLPHVSDGRIGLVRPSGRPLDPSAF